MKKTEKDNKAVTAGKCGDEEDGHERKEATSATGPNTPPVQASVVVVPLKVPAAHAVQPLAAPVVAEYVTALPP